jgi:hypothetical protein
MGAVKNATPNKPQIVVRVSPRLLGDVLCVAMRDKGLDAELHLDTEPQPGIASSARFDLALVTEELTSDVIADTVLVLDAGGSMLSVTRDGKDRVLADDAELGSLLDLIEGLLDGGDDVG